MLIHTAFHSGASYVPYWFANITLLFDVPVFFFLAGWALQINIKRGKNDGWGGIKAVLACGVNGLFLLSFD